MPEDAEKVEDFISLWRKKMDTESNKPSAIGDTLKRIQEVEQENEQLRTKIQANIDLISKTEEVVRKTIDENEKLKEELKNSGSFDRGNVEKIQQENLELSNKISSLTLSLTEKNNTINFKEDEIKELRLKLDEAASAVQFMADTASETGPDISQELLEDLKSELSKKKSQVSELEQKNLELSNEISSLNEQLIEKETKLQVDYVIPVETPESKIIRPQAAQTSSATLEILCQDLQADLNKYKKVIDKLNQDKSELQSAIDQGGVQIEPEEIKELKKENEQLKSDLSQIQETLKEKSKISIETLSLAESERLVEDLQKQLKAKDQIIAELKESRQPQMITPEGPMASLVEDLQKTINRLKISIEEKNKIIDELKSS